SDPAIIKITARISSAEWIGTTEYTSELNALITAGTTETEAKFILKNRSFTFDIGSNKTVIGEAGEDYGFKNINPKISGSNVIVKYLHFGDVIGDDYFGGTGNDAMSIKGGQHVWIDHCEFSSSLTPKEVDDTTIEFSDHKFPVDLEGENCTEEEKWTKDFYDGLLDVSETSRFVSISNSYFHDHWKACLCGGSNDKAESQPQGSQVRMTMYNNYFENIHSRQPLFRFGRAHIYSSYLKGADSDATGIEVRAESLVYVDNVYFENIRSDRTVGCWNSSSGLGEGKWTVQDCHGESNSNNAEFTPPYEWTKTSAGDSKTNLPTKAGVK
ncbi:polysaccharide lyase family 1 protein, partial [uncultured Treponema sp.]|uniref:pectate lyase family protein n=1 Tax=uncultured Treponema sp. TaxID=162155 RepID=UPI0035A61812